MNAKYLPMVVDRKASLPMLNAETPSFLGSPILNLNSLERGYDVIFKGVPWEGTLTWGSHTGCEMAPRSIRNASVRYGGYLPEYGINIFDYLRLGDAGDVTVNPHDSAATMRRVYEEIMGIYRIDSIPFTLGGDHSFTPEIIQALSENIDGNIGVIHFDSHFDNAVSFGDETLARCSPIHRISQIGKVRNESIVQLGIRGPRNSQFQAEYAKEMGATVYGILEIRRRGIQEVINEAIEIASKNTTHIYVTICSDCVDASFNPGGPADFNGLFSYELFTALYTLGEFGIAGLDYVEVYPNQDPHSFSSHLASWAVIYALAGMASKRRNDQLSRVMN